MCDPIAQCLVVSDAKACTSLGIQVQRNLFHRREAKNIILQTLQMEQHRENRCAARVRENACDPRRLRGKQRSLQCSQQVWTVGFHRNNDGIRSGGESMSRKVDWESDKVESSAEQSESVDGVGWERRVFENIDENLRRQVQHSCAMRHGEWDGAKGKLCVVMHSF